MCMEAPGFRPGPRVVNRAQACGYLAVLSIVYSPLSTFRPRQPLVRAQRLWRLSCAVQCYVPRKCLPRVEVLGASAFVHGRESLRVPGAAARGDFGHEAARGVEPHQGQALTHQGQALSSSPYLNLSRPDQVVLGLLSVGAQLHIECKT